MNRNYTYFCKGIDDIEVKEELCEEVIERMVNLKEFLSFSEKAPDKERNLRSILNCNKKNRLGGLNCRLFTFFPG